MTLTEFLLARIADDEAVARAAREHEYLSAARDASLLRWVRDSQGYGTIFVNSGRVLAECEAKRQIVEFHDYRGDRCGGHPGPYMPHADYGSGFCERADEDSSELRALATIYADHPDCREEWKP